MLKWRLKGTRPGTLLAAAALVLLHAWAVMALYFWFDGHPALRWGSAAAYVAAVLGIFRAARTRSHGALAGLLLLAGVAVWWSGRKAESGLLYPRETEQAAKLEVDGSMLTVHGLRDFRYRTLTDYKARWATRTYDLQQLEHVDLFFSYGGSTELAHVVTSFVFADQPPLSVSIELRAEQGEPVSLLRGFFKQYERFYVWADERDAIDLRTSHRKEQVYLHRTTLTPDQGRRLLLDMAGRSNALEEEPEFYHTLTDHCTNVMARHVDPVHGRKVPWYRRPFLTGKYEKLGYDEGWLVHTQPFPAHRAAASINQRALEGGNRPDFSRRIRSHLPQPEPEAIP